MIDGDFAMLPSELQGVLKALRGAGINIVAIHNHMAGERPSYVFLHYWGKGTAAALARGVKAALEVLGAGGGGAGGVGGGGVSNQDGGRGGGPRAGRPPHILCYERC